MTRGVWWLYRIAVCSWKGHRRHVTPGYDIYWTVCGRCGAHLP